MANTTRFTLLRQHTQLNPFKPLNMNVKEENLALVKDIFRPKLKVAARQENFQKSGQKLFTRTLRQINFSSFSMFLSSFFEILAHF